MSVAGRPVDASGMNASAAGCAEEAEDLVGQARTGRFCFSHQIIGDGPQGFRPALMPAESLAVLCVARRMRGPDVKRG
jgi:hypothetical protein